MEAPASRGRGTRRMRFRRMSWTRAVAAVGALAIVTALGGAPAGAVIGGAADHGRHPYVGAVDGRPVGGPVRFGTGVLVSPTVFLTVGHGTAHFDAAGVSR